MELISGRGGSVLLGGHLVLLELFIDSYGLLAIFSNFER